jgi:hypothetical protein
MFIDVKDTSIERCPHFHFEKLVNKSRLRYMYIPTTTLMLVRKLE